MLLAEFLLPGGWVQPGRIHEHGPGPASQSANERPAPARQSANHGPDPASQSGCFSLPQLWQEELEGEHVLEGDWP